MILASYSFDTPSSVLPRPYGQGSDGHRSSLTVADEIMRRGSWRIGTNPLPNDPNPPCITWSLPRFLCHQRSATRKPFHIPPLFSGDTTSLWHWSSPPCMNRVVEEGGRYPPGVPWHARSRATCHFDARTFLPTSLRIREASRGDHLKERILILA